MLYTEYVTPSHQVLTVSKALPLSKSRTEQISLTIPKGLISLPLSVDKVYYIDWHQLINYLCLRQGKT